MPSGTAGASGIGLSNVDTNLGSVYICGLLLAMKGPWPARRRLKDLLRSPNERINPCITGTCATEVTVH